MASLINSTRLTGIAILTTISKSAETMTDAVDSAQKGMDILHTKVRVAHAAQTQNTEIKIAQSKQKDLIESTTAHAEFIHESEQKLNKNPELKKVFDSLMSNYSSMQETPDTTSEEE